MRSSDDNAKQPRKLVTESYERCCLCGRLTDVRVWEPVELRKRYVPGAGQLCADCCWKVYHTDDLRSMM